jgi:hypothetical protein
VKWVAYHNGKEIPYWLGVLLALDQFVGALWPGADIDETISSRIGRRKQKMGGHIPFWRHPVAATIDRLLERIDPGHSIRSIGA